MKKPVYNVCFRCEYNAGNRTEHRQDLELKEIPKWIEAYMYTHPAVKSITCKLWTADAQKGLERAEGI